jgi:hypothetical protein
MVIEKDRFIEGVVRIVGDADGPRVVFFAGSMATRSAAFTPSRSSSSTSSAARVLKRGTLTPIRANEQALAAEQRYVKLNMNRLFRDRYDDGVDRTCYEFRTQQLKPLLETCDYFLDFHSAPSAHEPFLVAERKAVESYFKLGIRQLITAGANSLPARSAATRRISPVRRVRWQRRSNQARISTRAQSTSHTGRPCRCCSCSP